MENLYKKSEEINRQMEKAFVESGNYAKLKIVVGEDKYPVCELESHCDEIILTKLIMTLDTIRERLIEQAPNYKKIIKFMGFKSKYDGYINKDGEFKK